MDSYTLYPAKSIEEQIYSIERLKHRWNGLWYSYNNKDILIQDTEIIALRYSRPATKNKEFTPDFLNKTLYIFVSLIFSIILITTVKFNQIISMFSLALIGYAMYLTNPWKKEVNKKLTVSPTGLTWGSDFYSWKHIVILYIVTVNPEQKYESSSLYIVSNQEKIYRIPLDQVIGLITFKSDVASAIEHFRKRYVAE